MISILVADIQVRVLIKYSGSQEINIPLNLMLGPLTWPTIIWIHICFYTFSKTKLNFFVLKYYRFPHTPYSILENMELWLVGDN